jgi:hypothetical protein
MERSAHADITVGSRERFLFLLEKMEIFDIETF